MAMWNNQKVKLLGKLDHVEFMPSALGRGNSRTTAFARHSLKMVALKTSWLKFIASNFKPPENWTEDGLRCQLHNFSTSWLRWHRWRLQDPQTPNTKICCDLCAPKQRRWWKRFGGLGCRWSDRSQRLLEVCGKTIKTSWAPGSYATQPQDAWEAHDEDESLLGADGSWELERGGGF